MQKKSCSCILIEAVNVDLIDSVLQNLLLNRVHGDTNAVYVDHDL